MIMASDWSVSDHMTQIPASDWSIPQPSPAQVPELSSEEPVQQDEVEDDIEDAQDLGTAGVNILKCND